MFLRNNEDFLKSLSNVWHHLRFITKIRVPVIKSKTNGFLPIKL